METLNVHSRANELSASLAVSAPFAISNAEHVDATHQTRRTFCVALSALHMSLFNFAVIKACAAHSG